MILSSWQLYFFTQGTRPIHIPADLFASDLSPIPAEVPGNVELDLQRAGLLPDAFFGNNIHRLREYEMHEWWYVCKFWPDINRPGPIQLVFDGLDTFATIWLNDQPVGQSANMLITQRFDVTTALHLAAENTLVVRITPAMAAAREQRYEPGMHSWEHRPEGLHIRKAPHTWGWDIMPRAVSAGIWRPVRLEAGCPHAIEQLYAWTTEAKSSHATLGVFFQIHTGEQLSGLILRISGTCLTQPSMFSFDWPLEFIADTLTIPVENPSLWWPIGYGDPNLYTLTAQLCRGDLILAERSEKVGIRKLTLQTNTAMRTLASQTSVGAGEAVEWGFLVNDVPIFVKGTNWVPLDAFHSRDAARLAPALEMVADLGCNMIRCWGGNVYESDAFFNWCDEHGVLVWQDFAYACNIYPQDEAFLAEVRHEVQVVAERLRNHAALAVWCGDNEIDQVYISQGRDPAHNRLTREVIPQMLQRCDPHRPYIPSSPYISPANLKTPSETAEQHLWGPRGYFKADFYTHHTAQFIGEIGYHGCNEPASIAKFISPEHLWPPDNDEWQTHSVYHWRSRTIERDRIELMAKQVRAFFGQVPNNLSDFALASQITQAEALKYFIESTRQRKWRTSGILWWNLLDGWPQFSDAVVDYYFTKKLAYHYLWRAQRPVLVFIGEPSPGHSSQEPTSEGCVIISNDSLQTAEVAYRIWDGETEELLIQGQFTSPANQNWQVASITLNKATPRLLLIEWKSGGQIFGNHYLQYTPPLDFAQYRAWLPKIARLSRPFTY